MLAKKCKSNLRFGLPGLVLKFGHRANELAGIILRGEDQQINRYVGRIHVVLLWLQTLVNQVGVISLDDFNILG